MNDIQEKIEELKEKLAAIEHERWADWQQWVHDSALFVEYDGKLDHLEIPAKLFHHWDKQIKTKYQDLPEYSKQSDRDQVDRYWPLIQGIINQARKEAVIEELKSIRETMTLFPPNGIYDVSMAAVTVNDIDDRIKALKKDK